MRHALQCGVLGLAVAGVVAAAAAVASSAAQTRPPLAVGYLTHDGEIVPVARFDGTGWLNTWPEPIANDAPLPVSEVSGIPRGWLAQPVPLTWSVWTRAVRKPRTVTVTGVGRDGSCVEAITLSTSFKPEPRSEGLAFSRPTIAEEIVEAADGAPEREVLRGEVAPRFRAAAVSQPAHTRDEAGGLGSQALARGRTDTFATEDVHIEAVFRDSRFPVVYIAAERRFPDLPSDTAYDALSYRGWFRRDASRPGALIPIAVTLSAFSTGEGMLPRYTPIGVLRIGGRSIWVMSEWGKESQTIVLFEVSIKGVRRLLATSISGC
jgi:hypothetical protein